MYIAASHCIPAAVCSLCQCVGILPCRSDERTVMEWTVRLPHEGLRRHASQFLHNYVHRCFSLHSDRCMCSLPNRYLSSVYAAEGFEYEVVRVANGMSCLLVHVSILSQPCTLPLLIACHLPHVHFAEAREFFRVRGDGLHGDGMCGSFSACSVSPARVSIPTQP